MFKKNVINVTTLLFVLSSQDWLCVLLCGDITSFGNLVVYWYWLVSCVVFVALFFTLWLRILHCSFFTMRQRTMFQNKQWIFYFCKILLLCVHIYTMWSLNLPSKCFIKILIRTIINLSGQSFGHYAMEHTA